MISGVQSCEQNLTVPCFVDPKIEGPMFMTSSSKYGSWIIVCAEADIDSHTGGILLN